MARPPVNHPLDQLDAADLNGISRAVERMLAGSPLLAPGSRQHRRHAGSGLEFRDFRDFVPGDDPRSIDWRASARGTIPQVRRYYDDRSTDWMLCLDRSASMATAGGGKWHLALQLAAAFAYLLLDLEHRVGLVVFSEQVDELCRPGRGRAAFAHLLRQLYAVQASHGGSASRLASCIPHVPAGSQVLLLSDMLASDAMLPDLDRLSLRADGVRVLQLADPADCRADGAGQVTLTDIERGGSLSAWLDEALRERVAKAFSEWQAGLAAGCRQRGIAFSSSSVGDDWKSALLAHLSHRGPRLV